MIIISTIATILSLWYLHLSIRSAYAYGAVLIGRLCPHLSMSAFWFNVGNLLTVIWIIGMLGIQLTVAIITLASLISIPLFVAATVWGFYKIHSGRSYSPF